MKKLLLFLLLAILWISCQDLNSIQAPKEFDLKNHFGQYVDTTLYPDKVTFQINERENTINGLDLCVGTYKGFRAGFLLKFVALPSIDKEIDSVSLRLKSFSQFGQPTGMQTIEVYEVDQPWKEDANTEDTWHTYQPQNLLGTYTFETTDTLTFTFPIDTAVVNRWRREDSLNYGLYIQPAGDNGSVIREFLSLENNDPTVFPRLFFKVKNDSVFVKDSLALGNDATIFDYMPQGENIFDWAKNQGDLVIGSGIGVHPLLHFPGLDSLPKNSIVQGANLILRVKDQNFITNEEKNTYDNANSSDLFYIRNLSEANTDLTVFKLDSSFTTSSNFNYQMQQQEGNLQLLSEAEQTKFGENVVQNLLNGNKKSKGFYLRYEDEVSRLSFKRLDASSIKLNIRYFRMDNPGL